MVKVHRGTGERVWVLRVKAFELTSLPSKLTSIFVKLTSVYGIMTSVLMLSPAVEKSFTQREHQ